jgi:hypothetical protein
MKGTPMINKSSIMLIAVSIIFVATLACSAGETQHQSPSLEAKASPASSGIQASPSPPELPVKQGSEGKPSIRSIDFANFTYPYDCLGGKRKSFSLLNGKDPKSVDVVPMRLSFISYGDITGDSVDEAMVVLSAPFTGGTMRLNCVYVYTLQNEHPKLLWSFSTGDRADGGLRQVYGENGKLVVERYKSTANSGDCCAPLFTRARYEWQGNRFRQTGKEETLPNPDSESPSAPIMPPYRSRN